MGLLGDHDKGCKMQEFRHLHAAWTQSTKRRGGHKATEQKTEQNVEKVYKVGLVGWDASYNTRVTVHKGSEEQVISRLKPLDRSPMRPDVSFS